MELLALAVLLNAATGWMVLGPRDGAMAARPCLGACCLKCSLCLNCDTKFLLDSTYPALFLFAFEKKPPAFLTRSSDEALDDALLALGSKALGLKD